MTDATSRRLVRGRLLHYLDEPGAADARSGSFEYLPDGVLLIEAGRIVAATAWRALPEDWQGVPCSEHRGRLIVPGFVDTHAHYPQMRVMGSYGRELLDWLTHYTFPTEAEFADPEVCRVTAEFFLDRLLAHGTTSASVFATVHPQSVDAFFAAAEARGLRMLCGKVLMDRHCPESLRDTPERAARESEELIARWHGRARLGYTLTPRFAPTSSPEQLEVTGDLRRRHPCVHLQSHLSENAQELSWVAELFAGRRDYLDVYAHYGLLGERAIYAHGIHLSAAERQELAVTGTAISHCPSSNLFLGSGACDVAGLLEAGVRVGLGSDVGGGTSLSMLRTMAAAYEVSQLRLEPLTAHRAWYLATLGGARALGLDQAIGNFSAGREADFVVWNPALLPELAFRLDGDCPLEEELFALMMLGDDRCVEATYVQGERILPR